MKFNCRFYVLDGLEARYLIEPNRAVGALAFNNLSSSSSARSFSFTILKFRDGPAGYRAHITVHATPLFGA